MNEPRRLIRVSKDLTIKYNIEGWIDKIDLTDPHIKGLICQNVNPNLEYLSNAVSHLNQGRRMDSITEAFKIIEGDTKSVKDYYKYKCIRNILTHKKLEPHVKRDFTRYFGPSVYGVFDFKQYDPNNNIIILN